VNSKPLTEGWLRPDGQKGIRNHIAVVYTVECAEHVARKIAAPFSDIQFFGYDGCHCNDFVKRVFSSLVIHPNLYGIVIVSLGCEILNGEYLAEAAKSAGRETRLVNIQIDGGTTSSIEKGRSFVSELLVKRKNAERCDFHLSDLRIGTNCGGSDAMSGLASNPAVGSMYDMIIDSGGACFFDEITEMIGCADMASARASVIRVGERPQSPGLYLIDSIPDDLTRGVSPVNDAEDMSNAAAAGCHLLIFTTGRGTPMGSALMPVIKVCGSPKTCQVMKENIDIDTSDVLFGNVSVEDMSKRLLKEVITVVKGKRTAAERLGHMELHLHYMKQIHKPCLC